MAERINQHNNPLVGKNIKRLRFENRLKSKDVITQLQPDFYTYIAQNPCKD